MIPYGARMPAHPFFDPPTPLVIGHRGCAGELPENTLASFERGLSAGAVILETDVHLTRDGVPVLIHDDVVDRCTEGRGRVAIVQTPDSTNGYTAVIQIEDTKSGSDDYELELRWPRQGN